MSKKSTFFVNTDLLVEEGAFESLRDFLSHSAVDLQMYDTIDFDENHSVIIKHPDFAVTSSYITIEIFDKINKGYILINIDGLQKLVAAP